MASGSWLSMGFLLTRRCIGARRRGLPRVHTNASLYLTGNKGTSPRPPRPGSLGVLGCASGGCFVAIHAAHNGVREPGGHVFKVRCDGGEHAPFEDIRSGVLHRVHVIDLAGQPFKDRRGSHDGRSATGRELIAHTYKGTGKYCI